METSFEDTLTALAKRAASLSDTLLTEEATKTALVMPFIQALGYDIFDPNTVVPEYVADHGTKKGEKVDYAIKSGGEIIILIECKTYGANLSDVHLSQLYRYFSVTSSNIAIITNGLEYRFYSDLDVKNKMDNRPFFTFFLDSPNSNDFRELDKFRSEKFSIDTILESANDLKYLNLVKAELYKEIAEPSEEFSEIVARRVYAGRLSAGVKEWLGSLTAQAMRQVIRETVNRRLSEAIERPDAGENSDSKINTIDKADDGINTTQEEIDAFQVIRAILRKNIDPTRVHLRDAKSYCSIIMDNNNRKPIARLYLEGKKCRIGLLKNKVEERHEISSIDDIFNFADNLMEIAESYD